MLRRPIGVNITAFGRKLMLFFSANPLSRFSLKISHFFVAYFELGKCALCAPLGVKWNSDRLGNQLPVLGKANSLCKSVINGVCLPVCFKAAT